MRTEIRWDGMEWNGMTCTIFSYVTGHNRDVRHVMCSIHLFLLISAILSSTASHPSHSHPIPSHPISSHSIPSLTTNNQKQREVDVMSKRRKLSGGSSQFHHILVKHIRYLSPTPHLDLQTFIIIYHHLSSSSSLTHPPSPSYYHRPTSDLSSNS